MSSTDASTKKIKKFRVKPRPSSVLRGLKALMENPLATPELEKALEAEIAHAEPLFDTAALYVTFSHGEAPAWCEPLWRVDENTPTPVALTVFCATIGAGLENALGDALSRGEGLRSRILTALGEEAAGQSASFVQRLVGEEAAPEGCELSDVRPWNDPDGGRLLLDFLQASRVGISLDAAGHLSPRFTRMGSILWWPPAKKKK